VLKRNGVVHGVVGAGFSEPEEITALGGSNERIWLCRRRIRFRGSWLRLFFGWEQTVIRFHVPFGKSAFTRAGFLDRTLCDDRSETRRASSSHISNADSSKARKEEKISIDVNAAKIPAVAFKQQLTPAHSRPRVN
jgi:hypothetical protein